MVSFEEYVRSISVDPKKEEKSYREGTKFRSENRKELRKDHILIRKIKCGGKGFKEIYYSPASEEFRCLYFSGVSGIVSIKLLGKIDGLGRVYHSPFGPTDNGVFKEIGAERMNARDTIYARRILKMKGLADGTDWIKEGAICIPNKWIVFIRDSLVYQSDEIGNKVFSYAHFHFYHISMGEYESLRSKLERIKDKEEREVHRVEHIHKTYGKNLEYFIDEELANKYLDKALEQNTEEAIFIEPEFNSFADKNRIINRIETKKFSENRITAWLFQDKSQEYGDYLDNMGYKEVLLDLGDSKCYFNSLPQPFIRPLNIMFDDVAIALPLLSLSLNSLSHNGHSIAGLIRN